MRVMDDDKTGVAELTREFWYTGRTPGVAAERAAARAGVRLSPAAAEKIAAAVLEFADDEHRVRLEVAPQMWPQARATVLERLGIQMARDLVVMKVLPTALPREVVTGSVVPWESVMVELVVPVRKPST